ncbi:MAG: hypothetical protein ACI8PZ_000690 [Myxococcota bacterium]
MSTLEDSVILWLAVVALAGTKPGWLEMPITPSHPNTKDYIGLAKAPSSSGSEWESDDPHFTCKGAGDFVEIRVQADNWPARMPSKVTCTERGRGRTASVRIDIVDHQIEPMFVSNGTLVMPRLKNASAAFKGAPPSPDVVVGQGKSGELGIRCAVEPGPTLSIIVAGDHEDGEGACELRTTTGAPVSVPIVIVTVK